MSASVDAIPVLLLMSCGVIEYTSSECARGTYQVGHAYGDQHVNRDGAREPELGFISR